MAKVNTSDFGFIAFGDKQIEQVVELSGLDINKRGYVVEGKETVKCYSCGKAITVKRIGHVLPGSRIVCCKNPVCFATYVNEFLQE